MRSYTVATVALTLGVSAKWLDNTLSHHHVEGVLQTRQGVSRRLTPRAVLTLDLALALVQSLGMPLGRALDVAESLLSEGVSGLHLSRGITVGADVATISAELSVRLAAAVEATPVPKRGRPPAK